MPGTVGGEGVPQLPAYHDEHGMMHVWCRYCRRWHRHGRGGGHRAAHCDSPDSPYLQGGYELVPAGPWADAFGAAEEASTALAESAIEEDNDGG